MMEFALESRQELAEPDESELRRWIDEHQDLYVSTASYSFEQRFFARGADSRARAEASLLAGAPSEGALGPDPFLHGQLFERTPTAQLTGRFGEAFASTLQTLPSDEWAGPVESRYGWHLVYLRERHPPALPAFDAIRSRARADMMEDRRRAGLDAAINSLLQSYGLDAPAPRERP